jgi:hypothetical protein
MIESIGIIGVIIVGFILGFGVDSLLLYVTKWKEQTVGFIGAAVYGGFCGASGLAINQHWPMWFYALLSIIIFVVLQAVVLVEFELLIRKEKLNE